jgi:peptide/nickel transport system permease protein
MAIAPQIGEQAVPAAFTAPLTLRERLAVTARRNRFATAGLTLLVLALLLTFILPLFYGQDPDAVNAGETLQAPSGGHLLGTDALGRDMLARVIHAGRLDFLIAFAVAGLALAAGSIVGGLAGYAGGLVDDVAMRLVDLLLAFPAFILALVVTVMLGNRVGYVIGALAFAYTPFFVRLIRGEVLKIRNSEYADAARAVGNPAWRVAFRHVYPNAVSPAIVLATVVLGWAILDAAALGFLGIGIRPPTSEWGTMVSDGASNLDSGQWWTWLFPGLAILLVVLAFNWVGDGLRNLLRSA